jgi:hypothetical protein
MASEIFLFATAQSPLSDPKPPDTGSIWVALAGAFEGSPFFSRVSFAMRSDARRMAAMLGLCLFGEWPQHCETTILAEH